MRSVTRVALVVALLASPLAAAPEPPKPGLAEKLPRVVSAFLWRVHNEVARSLGLPSKPRGPDFVTRDVLLGPQPEDYQGLADLDVKAVLDMRAENADDARALAAHGMDYRHILVPDYEAPTPAQLREAVDFIRAHVRAGERVYVHCAAGIGRSATVVAAFLRQEYGWSADEAWSFLESKRPIVKHTDSQWEAIREFSPPSRSRGALGALDRGFERAHADAVRDLALERVRDAERDRER